MKKTLFALLAVGVIAFTACGSNQKKAAAPEKPTVYFTTDISPESLVRIYEALGKEATGRVAVKISTGEAGGHNYLKPELIGQLVQKVNGTIVECNTAYAGQRMSSEDHWQVIRDHGFDKIAKCDIMDEEGDMKIPVQDTTWLKYNIVGSHLADYDFLINLAHFKGHAMGGFGGVLKNASIGVASTNGKTYIHTAGKTEDASQLWGNLPPTNDPFTESMAAAAQAVHEYFKGNVLYINVLNNMSVDCDCSSNPAEPKLKDMGIAASLDPVAVDQFCIDMVFNMTPEEGNDNADLIERISSRHGTHILDQAEKIGLGSKEYNLVEL